MKAHQFFSFRRQMLTVTLCAVMLSAMTRMFAVSAQTTPVSTEVSNTQTSSALSIQVEPEQVKFTVQHAVASYRFEVKNQSGEIIFDSGNVRDAELLWKLQDSTGTALPSGLYNYALTIQERPAEAAKVQRGHFIIERADDRTADRVWLTTQDSQGVSVSGAQVTAARDGRGFIAGVRDEPQRGRAEGRKVAEDEAKTNGKKTPLEKDAISSTSTGTAGRIAKWLTTQDLGDSIIQETSGSIGIGTNTPGAKLDVVGTINATTQYNLGGNRMLSTPGSGNLFVGRDAGSSNFAGLGFGENNTFSGYQAGAFNVTGYSNTFSGSFAGRYNTEGSYNTFNGHNAGYANTKGSYNTFDGVNAGHYNTTGSSNIFIGPFAGTGNTTGANNTFIGYLTTAGVGNLTNATAIGFAARVDCSYCLVLGQDSVVTSTKVGIGTTTPTRNLHVLGRGVVETRLESRNERTILALDSIFGTARRVWSIENGLFGTPGMFGIFDATAGAARLTIDTAGCIRHGNGTVIAGACSSDLRFKQGITPFANVLHKLMALRPVQYYWRTSEFPQQHFGSEQSYGLIAQEVESVLPELVSTDEQGYKRVDYSRLPLLTIQAMKEQQSQVAELQKQNASLTQQNISQQHRLQQQQQLLTVLRQRLETVERILTHKKRNR